MRLTNKIPSRYTCKESSPKLTAVAVMAEEEEVDLFEEKKEKEKSLALAEEKRLQQHKPITNQLFDDKEDKNKILEEKELKKEIFEVEIDDSEDAEQIDSSILEKLKSLGISEQDVKIDVSLPSTNSGSNADDLVESLEDEDIQKYIGGEDGNDNDKLFG